LREREPCEKTAQAKADAVTKAIVRNGVLLLALILQWGACPRAFAQMAKSEQFFADPVPRAVLGPFAEFLTRLHVKDVKATIAKTRFGYIGNSRSLGFRVEDKDYNTCINDRCLTIIGKVVEQRFVADAMFLAGAKAQGADGVLPFFGLATLPYFFRSPDGDVLLIETPEGWVVSSIKN
jgi:hypothetical protein